jgi:hypothetical protein
MNIVVQLTDDEYELVEREAKRRGVKVQALVDRLVQFALAGLRFVRR